MIKTMKIGKSCEIGEIPSDDVKRMEMVSQSSWRSSDGNWTNPGNMMILLKPINGPLDIEKKKVLIRITILEFDENILKLIKY